MPVEDRFSLYRFASEDSHKSTSHHAPRSMKCHQKSLEKNLTRSRNTRNTYQKNSQRLPKWSQKLPKALKRHPRAPQRLPKGAQVSPRGSLGATNPPEKVPKRPSLPFSSTVPAPPNSEHLTLGPASRGPGGPGERSPGPPGSSSAPLCAPGGQKLDFWVGFFHANQRPLRTSGPRGPNLDF